MNKIDLWVIKITSEPYEEYGKWFLDVMSESHGSISYNTIMFNTFFEADSVAIGYKFKS